VLKVSKPCAISHSFCLNEYKFSIHSDSISKQNIAIYSSLAMSISKTKQKCSKLPQAIGKKKR
jgi:hypothetical protein